MPDDTINSELKPESEDSFEEVLRKAKIVVLDQIIKRKEELERCTNDNPDSLGGSLSGETTEGYDAQVVFDAELLAHIMLKHHYYIYEVLGMEGPAGMMTEIALRAGLRAVDRVWLE